MSATRPTTNTQHDETNQALNYISYIIGVLANITDACSLEIPAAGTLDGALRLAYTAHGLDHTETLPGIAKALLIFWPAEETQEPR